MIGQRLLTVFLPWLRVAELSGEARWLLDGWNRACVINDGLRDALERSHDRYVELMRCTAAEQQRNRELAEEIGALREGIAPRVAGPQASQGTRKDGATPHPNQPRDGTS
jgi:hypothetical protein